MEEIFVCSCCFSSLYPPETEKQRREWISWGGSCSAIRRHESNVLCRQLLPQVFFFASFFSLPDIKTNLCPATVAHLRAAFWCVIIRTSGVCKSVRTREIGSWGKKMRWFKSTFLFFSFFGRSFGNLAKNTLRFTFWTFPAFNWTCQAPRRIGTAQVRCSQCAEHPAAKGWGRTRGSCD